MLNIVQDAENSNKDKQFHSKIIGNGPMRFAIGFKTVILYHVSVWCCHKEENVMIRFKKFLPLLLAILAFHLFAEAVPAPVAQALKLSEQASAKRFPNADSVLL